VVRVMKTIMISDDAYKKLSSVKDGKSFTEVVSELVDTLKQVNTKGIMEFAGIMSEKEADELEKITTKIRKNARVRI
jgi:predicted CopG family antitoxin